MKLKRALITFSTILENGPLGTRLKYDYGRDGYDYYSDDSEAKRASALNFLSIFTKKQTVNDVSEKKENTPLLASK